MERSSLRQRAPETRMFAVSGRGRDASIFSRVRVSGTNDEKYAGEGTAVELSGKCSSFAVHARWLLTRATSSQRAAKIILKLV